MVENSFYFVLLSKQQNNSFHSVRYFYCPREQNCRLYKGSILIACEFSAKWVKNEPKAIPNGFVRTLTDLFTSVLYTPLILKTNLQVVIENQIEKLLLNKLLMTFGVIVTLTISA